MLNCLNKYELYIENFKLKAYIIKKNLTFGGAGQNLPQLSLSVNLRSKKSLEITDKKIF